MGANSSSISNSMQSNPTKMIRWIPIDFTRLGPSASNMAFVQIPIPVTEPDGDPVSPRSAPSHDHVVVDLESGIGRGVDMVEGDGSMEPDGVVSSKPHMGQDDGRMVNMPEMSLVCDLFKLHLDLANGLQQQQQQVVIKEDSDVHQFFAQRGVNFALAGAHNDTSWYWACVRDLRWYEESIYHQSQCAAFYRRCEETDPKSTDHKIVLMDQDGVNVYEELVELRAAIRAMDISGLIGSLLSTQKNLQGIEKSHAIQIDHLCDLFGFTIDDGPDYSGAPAVREGGESEAQTSDPPVAGCRPRLVNGDLIPTDSAHSHPIALTSSRKRPISDPGSNHAASQASCSSSQTSTQSKNHRESHPGAASTPSASNTQKSSARSNVKIITQIATNNLLNGRPLFHTNPDAPGRAAKEKYSD